MATLTLLLLLLIACTKPTHGNTFNMTEVQKLIADKCVLLFVPPYNNNTASLLDPLQLIFAITNKVAVGKLEDNISISWQVDQHVAAFDGGIVLYKHVPRDRTCLVSTQRSLPVADQYSGSLHTASIVEYVNENCGTFVTATGGLTAAGLLEQQIVHNLFEPSGEERVCERITMPSKEQFFSEYLIRSKPVIIENGLLEWPAMQKWTQDFLNDEFGEQFVHIKLTPDGIFEGVESVHLWEDYDSFIIPDFVKGQLEFPDLVVVRPATQELKFADFLNSLSSQNYSSYLEYSSIPEYLPQLEQDLSELPIVTDLLTRHHLNIWLSDGNTLGKLHFDPYDNLLCQIRGRKEVTLYDPRHNHNLYEAHIPEAILGFNPSTNQFRRQRLLESTSMVMSPVDIKKPDFYRFPLFSQTKPYQCNINEGDVLYMPAFWWHEVQSRPNPAEKRNLAVNFWYEPFLNKEFPCPNCKLQVNMFYRHLLDHPPV